MPERQPPHSGDELEAELVLFVDGGLEPERTAAIEKLVASDSGLARTIALVRGGRDRLHAAAGATEAPFELRRRVDDLAARPRRARLRLRPLALLAGTVAMAAVVVALALSASGPPGVGDVLEAALRPPVATVTPSEGPLLDVKVDGVRFPNYEEKFGWRATGRREGEVEGRLVRTVTYRKGGERIAYSIVAGDALEEPEGDDLEAEGTRLRRIGDANAVTWQREGHTCVMEGTPGVGLDTVAELAGWKAKGEIPF